MQGSEISGKKNRSSCFWNTCWWWKYSRLFSIIGDLITFLELLINLMEIKADGDIQKWLAFLCRAEGRSWGNQNTSMLDRMKVNLLFPLGFYFWTVKREKKIDFFRIFMQAKLTRRATCFNVKKMMERVEMKSDNFEAFLKSFEDEKVWASWGPLSEQSF